MEKPSYITRILVCKERTPAKIEFSIWKWTRLYSQHFQCIAIPYKQTSPFQHFGCISNPYKQTSPKHESQCISIPDKQTSPFSSNNFFYVPNTFQGSLYSTCTKETFQKEIYCVNTKFTFQKVNIYEISKMNLSMQIRRDISTCQFIELFHGISIPHF